jgi:hypothetical protein
MYSYISDLCIAALQENICDARAAVTRETLRRVRCSVRSSMYEQQDQFIYCSECTKYCGVPYACVVS